MWQRAEDFRTKNCQQEISNFCLHIHCGTLTQTSQTSSLCQFPQLKILIYVSSESENQSFVLNCKLSHCLDGNMVPYPALIITRWHPWWRRKLWKHKQRKYDIQGPFWSTVPVISDWSLKLLILPENKCVKVNSPGLSSRCICCV